MAVKTDEEKWWKSRTVMGGALIAFGGVATAVGGYLTGTMTFDVLVTTVIPLIGGGLSIIGYRLKK